MPRVETRPRPALPVAPGPVLALDLGASRIRAALVSPDGRLHARTEGRTPGELGPDAVVDACIDRLRATLDAVAPADRRAIVAVGIAAPGPVDPRTGTIVDPPNMGPDIHDVALAPAVADALSLPAVLDRDTQVAALAEMAFGAARDARDVVYLTVSTGIGGAVVSDGRLITGPDGTAGELGHLPVELDGPPCGCGASGHLEAIASGSAIARLAREAAASGEAPGLAALVRSLAPVRLEARHVAEAEERGDPHAAAIMERARRAFAAVCVGLVDVFDPELIVVGGSVARNQGERWLAPARREVERFGFRVPARRVRIVGAGLGDDVGLVGSQPLVALRLAEGGLIHPSTIAAPVGAAGGKRS
jgi:glucokinase